MRIQQPPISKISEITIDADIDFLNTYQVKNLAAPATGEALRKGYRLEMVDMPDMLLNKVMVGQGLTVSPVEETKPREDILSGKEADKPPATYVKEGQIFLCFDKPYKYVFTAGAWVRSYDEAYYKYPEATLANFQAGTPGGTFATPANVNDNNIATETYGTAVGKVVTVTFATLVKIDQWRQYGATGLTGDGRYKLQYKNIEGNWIDWVTNIPVRGVSWSAMASATEVITNAISLEITTLDTSGTNALNELEVYHS